MTQFSGWAKRKLQSTSKSQTCTKKSWSLFGGLLLASLIQYSFLKPCKEIWEVFSANWGDMLKTVMPRTSISHQKGPNPLWQYPATRHTENTSKVKWIGLQSFASSAIFTWPFCQLTTTSSSILTTFSGKMLPQPGGGRKCFPRVCLILKHGVLCYRSKQTSHWQKNVLIIMVPILINFKMYLILVIMI